MRMTVTTNVSLAVMSNTEAFVIEITVAAAFDNAGAVVSPNIYVTARDGSTNGVFREHRGPVVTFIRFIGLLATTRRARPPVGAGSNF
jgi:hypothetical protein